MPVPPRLLTTRRSLRAWGPTVASHAGFLARRGKIAGRERELLLAPPPLASIKAWDALHRCLTDGRLNNHDGDTVLGRVFFGGRILNEADDYFVVLVTPEQVKEIAGALATVTEESLRHRYFELPFPDYQGEKSEEDCEYTIGHFVGLPEFYDRAAHLNRYVIFTVSQ